MRNTQHYSDISDTESLAYDTQMRSPVPNHSMLSQMFDNVNNNMKDPITKAAVMAPKFSSKSASPRRPCSNFTDLVSELTNILSQKKNRTRVTIKQVVGGQVRVQTVLEKGGEAKNITYKTTIEQASPGSVDSSYSTDEPKRTPPPPKRSVCNFMWKPRKKPPPPQEASTSNSIYNKPQHHPMQPPLSTTRHIMSKSSSSSCGDSNYGSEETFTSPGTDFSSPVGNPMSPGYGFIQKPTNKYAPIVNSNGAKAEGQDDFWKQLSDGSLGPSVDTERFSSVDPNDILSMPSPTSSVCSVTSSVLEREPLLPIGEMLRHLEKKAKTAEVPEKVERRNSSAVGARLLHRSGAGKGKPSAYVRHKALLHDLKGSLQKKRGRKKKSETDPLYVEENVSSMDSPHAKFSGLSGSRSRSRSISPEPGPKKRGRPKGSKNRTTLMKIQKAEEERARLEAEIAWRTSFNKDISEQEKKLAEANAILEKSGINVNRGRSPTKKGGTNSVEESTGLGQSMGKKKKGRQKRSSSPKVAADPDESNFLQDTNIQTVNTEEDTSLAAELLSSCLQYTSSASTSTPANQEIGNDAAKLNQDIASTNEEEGTQIIPANEQQDSNSLETHENQDDNVAPANDNNFDTNGTVENEPSLSKRDKKEKRFSPIVKLVKCGKKGKVNKLKIKLRGRMSPVQSASGSEDELYSSCHSQVSDGGNESDIPEPMNNSTPEPNESQEKTGDQSSKQEPSRDIRDRSFTDVFNVPMSPDNDEDQSNSSRDANEEDDNMMSNELHLPSVDLDKTTSNSSKETGSNVDQSDDGGADSYPIENQDDESVENTGNISLNTSSDMSEFTTVVNGISVHEEVVETTRNSSSNNSSTWSTRENTPDDVAACLDKKSVRKLKRDGTVVISSKDKDAIPEELRLQDGNKDGSTEEMYGDSEPERDKHKRLRKRRKKATPSLASMVSVYLDTAHVEEEEEPGQDRKLRSSSMTSGNESVTSPGKDADNFTEPLPPSKGSPRKSSGKSSRNSRKYSGRDSSQEGVSTRHVARSSSSEPTPEVSRKSRPRKKKKKKRSASELLRKEECQSASSRESSTEKSPEKTITITAEVHDLSVGFGVSSHRSTSSRDSSYDSDMSLRRSPRLRSPNGTYNPNEWELSPAPDSTPTHSPRNRIPKMVLKYKYPPVPSPRSEVLSPRAPGSSPRPDINKLHPVASPRPIKDDSTARSKSERGNSSRESSLDTGTSPRSESRTRSPRKQRQRDSSQESISPGPSTRGAVRSRRDTSKESLSPEPSKKRPANAKSSSKNKNVEGVGKDLSGDEAIDKIEGNKDADVSFYSQCSPRSSSPEPEKFEYLKIGTQNKGLKVKLNAGAQVLFANGMADLNPSVVLTDLRYSLRVRQSTKEKEDESENSEETSSEDSEDEATLTDDAKFREAEPKDSIVASTQENGERRRHRSGPPSTCLITGRHKTKAELKAPFKKPAEPKKKQLPKQVSFIPEDVSNFYSPEYCMFSPQSNASFMSPPNPFGSPSFTAPATSASREHVYSAVPMDSESTSSEEPAADRTSVSSESPEPKLVLTRSASMGDLPSLARNLEEQEDGPPSGPSSPRKSQSAGTAKGQQQAERERAAELMEKVRSYKVNLVSLLNKTQKILEKSGVDPGKPKDGRKRHKSRSVVPFSSQEPETPSGNSTPDVLRELSMDHNKIRNLLQADPGINEDAPRLERETTQNAVATTATAVATRVGRSTVQNAPTATAVTAEPSTESPTDEVLPWSPKDLKATPVRSNVVVDDNPPFFSPLQTRAARRKKNGGGTGNEPQRAATTPVSQNTGPVQAPNESTKTPSNESKTPTNQNRGRTISKEETQPKPRSRSKSASRRRGRSRSRSKSRSRKTKAQRSPSESPPAQTLVGAEEPVVQSSDSQDVTVNERSRSPKPAPAKRPRSKSSTRAESDADVSPTAKRRRSRSVSKTEDREREQSPVPSTSKSRSKEIQSEHRGLDGHDSDASDMPLARYANWNRHGTREVSPSSVNRRGKSVPRDTSAARSPSLVSRLSRRAKSRSKSVPREIPEDRRRSLHREREVSPRDFNRKHRSRSSGRYNRGKSRSPARGRSASRSPPRTRERISRARSSTRRAKSRRKSTTHSRSSSRSRSRSGSPFHTRRTRNQSRSPIRRKGDGKYTAGNKYKRTQSEPRDIAMSTWAKFGSPSTEDSSSVHSDFGLDNIEDVPMLNDEQTEGEAQSPTSSQEGTPAEQQEKSRVKVIPVVPLVDVLSEDETSQYRPSRERYKSSPGQNCSVVVKALSKEDIERSIRQRQLSNTLLAAPSASRDSSQTSLYSDSSVSPTRRKTRASSQDSVEDASQDGVAKSPKPYSSILARLAKEANVYQNYIVRSPKPRESSRSSDRSLSTGRTDEKVEAVKKTTKQRPKARSKSADGRKAKQSNIYENKFLSKSGKSPPRESSRSSERGNSADNRTGDETQPEKETQEVTSHGKRKSHGSPGKSTERSVPSGNYRDDRTQNRQGVRMANALKRLTDEASLYQSFTTSTERSREGSRSSDRGHSPAQPISKAKESTKSAERTRSPTPKAEKPAEKATQKPTDKKKTSGISDKPSLFEQFEQMTEEYAEKPQPTKTKRSRRKSVPSKLAEMSPATEARSIEELQNEWTITTPTKIKEKTADSAVSAVGESSALFSPFKALGLDKQAAHESDFSDDELPDLVAPKTKTMRSKFFTSGSSVDSSESDMPKFKVQNPLSPNAKKVLRKSSNLDVVASPSHSIDDDNWLDSNVIEPSDVTKPPQSGNSVKNATGNKRKTRIGPAFTKRTQQQAAKAKLKIGPKFTKEPKEKIRPKVTKEANPSIGSKFTIDETPTIGLKFTKEKKPKIGPKFTKEPKEKIRPKVTKEANPSIGSKFTTDETPTIGLKFTKEKKPKIGPKFTKTRIKAEPNVDDKSYRLKRKIVGPNNEIYDGLAPLGNSMFNIRIVLERHPDIELMAQKYKARRMKKNKPKATGAKNTSLAGLPKIPKLPPEQAEKANTRKRHASQGVVDAAKRARLDDISSYSNENSWKPGGFRYQHQGAYESAGLNSSSQWSGGASWSESPVDEDDMATGGSLQEKLNQLRSHHQPRRPSRGMDLFSPPPSPPAGNSGYSRLSTGSGNRSSSRLIYQSPRPEDADGVAMLQIVNVMGGYQEQQPQQQQSSNSNSRQVTVKHGTHTYTATVEDSAFRPMSPDAYKLPHIAKETAAHAAFYTNDGASGQLVGQGQGQRSSRTVMSPSGEDSDGDSERLVISLDDDEIDIEGFSDGESSELLLIKTNGMGMMMSRVVQEEELDTVSDE